MPSKKHPAAHHAHHLKEKAETTGLLLKPAKLRSKALLVVIVLLVASGIFLIYKSFAASDSLSLVSSDTTPSLGQSFTVTIHENSNTDAINAVQANLTYTTSKLQLVGIDTSTSAFSLQGANTGANGAISIARANTTTLTGDHIVAVLTFTAIGAGSTGLNFDTANSSLVRASDTTDVLATTTNVTYTIADTQAPTVPTALTAGTKTVNSLALSWAASTDNVGVTGYNILRNGTKIGTSATASFSDTGLTPNTSYSYAVQAFDAAGNTSANSSALAMSTLPDTTAPSVPAGLTLGARTVTTIGLSWTAATDNVGVTTYKIFRDGTQINTSTSTSYTDSGLAPNSSHSYKVAAADAAGNTSAQSTALAASTLPDTTAPSAPTGLISPSKATTTIGLSWNPATDNVAVTGYKIFRGGAQVGTSATTSFTDTGLTQGTAYSYTVAAVDAAGNTSTQSAASSFSTILKPGDVNGDGTVGILDLSLIASHFNQPGTYGQGDLNGDGVVDIFDLSVLASHWGS